MQNTVQIRKKNDYFATKTFFWCYLSFTFRALDVISFIRAGAEMYIEHLYEHHRNPVRKGVRKEAAEKRLLDAGGESNNVRTITKV